MTLNEISGISRLSNRTPMPWRRSQRSVVPRWRSFISA
jgi:hypothetical protein